MIQRSQTVFLFIAAVVMAFAVFMPLATFYGEGHEVTLTAFSVTETTNPDAPLPLPEFGTIIVFLGALLAISALLPLITLFLYKKRFLQLRLCFAEIVLLVGSQGFIAYYIYNLRNSFDVMVWKFGVPSILPLVSLIFIILAMRGIIHDDKLVKSLDRIR